MKNETLEQMIKAGIVKLTVLTGDAPAQHNPQPVDISGTITAPSIFLEKREVKAENSHCLVSKTDGTMKLIVNEQSVVDKFTVEGKITLGKLFKKLGINSDIDYTPKELSNKLRLLRAIFTSPSEHMKLVKSLRNIEAKVDQILSEKDDNRGNNKIAYSQEVQSNIPESVTWRIPLIEGDSPTEIQIDILLTAESVGSIKCSLESVDGAEMIDQQFEKLINEEVEKIKGKTTVIFH